MTNRDKLINRFNQMSTFEFACWIAQSDASCEHCSCTLEECTGDCAKGVQKWLESEVSDE